jgi:hypothetical protein
MSTYNFDIKSSSTISQNFTSRQVNTFVDACNYIRQLPYKRNSNKADLSSVFVDQYGTCSTKHALLRQLAVENKEDKIKLILGVFKMSKLNTPQIGATLDMYGLTYILEAHNYLSFGNEIIDCTKTSFSVDNFVADLVAEIEIEPNQITDYKVNYHKQILQKWLSENSQINLSFNELWTIREQCIEDLSKWTENASQ